MTERIPLGMKITQVAIVVHDLKKTMEAYYRTLGWQPWSVFEYRPPLLHDTMLRGKPTEYRMIGAEVHCDPVDFEILQPTEGDSIYKEFLERHGEGLHHISVVSRKEDVHATLANFKRQGIDVLMSGRIGSDIEYYYLDTEPRLKMIAETVSGHAISLKPSWTYP
jgi:methylmalonyl-CoA/ethylmalonyl-CoA epimerase